MPRRNPLWNLSSNKTSPQRCALTGSDDDVQVSGWRQTAVHRSHLYPVGGGDIRSRPITAAVKGWGRIPGWSIPNQVALDIATGLAWCPKSDGLRLAGRLRLDWAGTSRVREMSGRSEARLNAPAILMGCMKALLCRKHMPLPAGRAGQAGPDELDETAIRLVRAADAVSRLLGYARSARRRVPPLRRHRCIPRRRTSFERTRKIVGAN